MPVTSSNMSLKTPTAGETDYATSVADSNTLVDAHDHTTGKGVQIPTAGITDLAVTAAKLAANAVTTAKITDANVTKAKLAALGQQVSSSCGTFSGSATSYTAITNLTVTITLTGRPVFIGLVPDAAGTAPAMASIALSADGAGSMDIAFLDGGVTVLAEHRMEVNAEGVTIGPAMAVPVGSFGTVYAGLSAGAHTIAAFYKVSNGATVTGAIQYAKLMVFEL